MMLLYKGYSCIEEKKREYPLPPETIPIKASIKRREQKKMIRISKKKKDSSKNIAKDRARAEFHLSNEQTNGSIPFVFLRSQL